MVLLHGEKMPMMLCNAVVMEQVAKMASIAFAANPHLTMNSLLIEKHFSRKHGPNAYYGQK